MNIVVKRKDETDISSKQIVELMLSAFEERLQQGLNFSCSSITVELFDEETADGIVLLAIDKDTNALVGTVTVHLCKDKQNVVYADFCKLAVNPDVKHCGIGSMLLRESVNVVKNAGGEYIISDTAVGAESSVKYHLKNGFKIIGLYSYPSTNYYSYLFRKQLVQSTKWDSDCYCKFRFLTSYFKTKLRLKKDGSMTSLYKMYKRIKRFLIHNSICLI